MPELAEYELTQADADAINGVTVRSHSDVQKGDVFPAVVSRVDDIVEHVPDRNAPGGVSVEKVGELTHYTVFLPDGPHAFHERKLDNPPADDTAPAPAPTNDQIMSFLRSQGFPGFGDNPPAPAPQENTPATATRENTPERATTSTTEAPPVPSAEAADVAAAGQENQQ